MARLRLLAETLWHVPTEFKLLIAVLAPIVIEICCMLRFYDINATGSVVGFAIGLVMISFVRTPWWGRVIMAVVYLAVMLVVMFYIGASMACSMYHSCL